MTPPASPRALPSILAALLAGVALLFLAGPVATLAGAGGAQGLAALGTDPELRRALGWTVLAASLATLCAAALGVPLAWLLATRRFRGRALVEALVELPVLIPHPVAGVALLLVLGRDTVVGGTLLALGLRVVSAPAGLVAAMTFVAMPLFVSAARETFARIDPRFAGVARTLGDTPWRAFRRVTLPMARGGLLAAAAVTWARAASEFGAIVVLAYHPRVASVLAWDRFANDGLDAALPVAGALLAVALVPLGALALLRARGAEERE